MCNLFGVVGIICGLQLCKVNTLIFGQITMRGSLWFIGNNAISVVMADYNYPELSCASNNVAVWQGMSDFNTSDHALDLVGFVWACCSTNFYFNHCTVWCAYDDCIEAHQSSLQLQCSKKRVNCHSAKHWLVPPILNIVQTKKESNDNDTSTSSLTPLPSSSSKQSAEATKATPKKKRKSTKPHTSLTFKLGKPRTDRRNTPLPKSTKTIFPARPWKLSFTITTKRHTREQSKSTSTSSIAATIVKEGME